MKRMSFAFWANIAAAVFNALVVAYVPGEHPVNLFCVGFSSGVALILASIRD